MSASPSVAAPVGDVVAQADALLCADRQYGDSAAIGERNLARFRLGLTLLARQDEEAAPLLRAIAAAQAEHLRPLLYDPVLRNCFEVDLVRLERGRLDGSSFALHARELTATQELVASTAVSGKAVGTAAEPGETAAPGPCESLTVPHLRAWPGLGDAWVLTGLTPRDAAEEQLGGRLMELYRDALGAGHAADPLLPSAEVRSTLREGAELLAALLPATGAGVLRHVTMVGFTHRESEEGPLQSMSGGDPLPSAVLLAPERCASPWLAAESLLHEGSHLKLFDALRTGAVVRNATERVPIPWRIGSWTVIRVFVALHFYVHLLAFRAAGTAAGPEIRERFGTPPPPEELDEPSPGTPAALAGTHRTSEERARHLAEQVLALPPGALTENGHRFARWLLAALRLVDADAPRPPERTDPDTRDTETPAAAAAEAPPAGATLRRTAPVDACALPGLGQLLVSAGQSGRMHWLGARAWSVYSLCEQSGPEALYPAYARACGLDAASPEVRAQVDGSLRQLLAAGLVSWEA
ncbi:HEXXH motif-containing putative peptide modification protein [Streptomyces physcomitrii]|uniref:aKG-HExxH-type peptide beta-hydroxylase n=1 Tax=Streptomyces physcomitrii TaxID=2724184 RepID=UPI00343C98A6